MRRFWPRRRRGFLWLGLTLGIVLNGLRLRDRLKRLATLPASPDPANSDLVGPEAFGGLTFITATGVVVDDETRAAVAVHAASEGLGAVDLVPADLPIEQALDVARQLESANYRSDRLAHGVSALHALAVNADVLARLDLSSEAGLDQVQMAVLARRAKQCAPTTFDLLVAPGLRAHYADPNHRLGTARALAGRAAPLLVAAPIAQYGVMLAGIVLSPGWGLASLLASACQPWIATAGTSIAPVDRQPLAAASRWFRLPRDATLAMASQWKPAVVVPADPRAVEERRPIYRQLLAEGTGRFFEERRETCPLCGCGDLQLRATVGDLLQHKPGQFELDECPGCGHVFQNPRLSLEGLDFYYRDAYDGLAADEAESLFAATEGAYRARVRMVAANVPVPDRWLDVGGGHGHFCLVAADELPTTQFDGLDVSESILDAERRGWVTNGYQGLFPDLAPSIAATYDVVTMYHYLEHTREPWAEIDAARVALAAGGHLLIEVPNPDCLFNRAVGPLWGPWFQPQHQHFVSLHNLSRALADRGFTVVATDIGEAHQPADFSYALWNFGQHVAPHPARPWLPDPTSAERVKRAAIFAALGPLFLVALVADRISAPLVRRFPEASNAYRVLARLEPESNERADQDVTS